MAQSQDKTKIGLTFSVKLLGSAVVVAVAGVGAEDGLEVEGLEAGAARGPDAGALFTPGWCDPSCSLIKRSKLKASLES